MSDIHTSGEIQRYLLAFMSHVGVSVLWLIDRHKPHPRWPCMWLNYRSLGPTNGEPAGTRYRSAKCQAQQISRGLRRSMMS